VELYLHFSMYLPGIVFKEQGQLCLYFNTVYSYFVIYDFCSNFRADNEGESQNNSV
jgi:hypothetical protein